MSNDVIAFVAPELDEDTRTMLESYGVHIIDVTEGDLDALIEEWE